MMSDNGLGQVVSWYICTVSTVPFVVLRMYSRWARSGGLAIEDLFIILALCCLGGDLGIQQHMWNLGLGDLSTVSHEHLKGIMKMIVPGSILYISSLWAVKFALVFLYKRLAIPGSRLLLLYNVALGFLVATYLILFFDIIFSCYPHDKRWSTDPNYKCEPEATRANFWMMTIFNIFSDVVIICLPITMVLRLQMKLKQKLAVSGIFALGFFVVISSIVRAYYSHTNQTMITCTVSMIENAIAIIASCLPALRSMLIGGSTNASTSYNAHYELGSARRGTMNTRTGVSTGGVTSSAIGTTSKRGHQPNSSEDSLVASGLSVGLDGRGKIRVDTTIEAMYDNADTRSNAGSSKTRAS